MNNVVWLKYYTISIMASGWTEKMTKCINICLLDEADEADEADDIADLSIRG